jgi:ribosome-interacting GTPase 1
MPSKVYDGIKYRKPVIAFHPGSGKHDGVMVKRNHVLKDGDIIELHM